MSEQSVDSRVTKAEAEITNLGESVDRLSREMSDGFEEMRKGLRIVEETVNRQRQVTVPIILSMIGTVGVVAAGLIGLTQLLASSSIAPVAYRQEAIITNFVRLDKDLQNNVGRLHVRLDDHDTKYGHPKLSQEHAAFKSKIIGELTEMETQFGYTDQHIRMLWKKVYLEDMPPIQRRAISRNGKTH